MYRVESAERQSVHLTKIIESAAHNLKSSQNGTGAWTECFDTGVMPDAQTVISLYLLGISDREWTLPLLKRIEVSQRDDGAWSVYPGDGGDLSTTVECYYALELYNKWNGRHTQRSAAKRFILQNGGLRKCRNLTKMFLAVGGEIPWSWLPSPVIYSWLFAKHAPVQIRKLVMFTRLHVPPMVLLAALRYVALTIQRPVLSEFLSPRTSAALERQKTTAGVTTKARYRRCAEVMMAEREADGTAAGYHSSTFLVLFALRALGYESSSAEFQSPLRAMKQNRYPIDSHTVCHQQTCNAHVWNTSLALQALEQSGENTNIFAVKTGLAYLLARQQTDAGNWVMKSVSQVGGWGFSHNNTRHPDTDDTVSCLQALHPVRRHHQEAWQKGIQWLLEMQNRDGGWSAFEKDSNSTWLERLPANDMKHAMTDPSTADITGRVVSFLIRSGAVSRQDPIVKHGVEWLVGRQEKDGSWFGRWGTTYIYGTWCAVQALTAADVSVPTHVMQRVKHFLLCVQREDGSFGESCESHLKGKFVPLEYGTPSQTAWGLDTLLYLIRVEPSVHGRGQLVAAAKAAATWLMQSSQLGIWKEDYPTGAAFPGALHIHYHIYPKVWPLIALSHYRALLGELALSEPYL